MLLSSAFTANCITRCLPSRIGPHSIRQPLAVTALLATTTPPGYALSTSSLTATVMPQLPLKYESSSVSLDLSSLSDHMNRAEERRQQAFDLARLIQSTFVQAGNAVGEPDATAPLQALVANPEHQSLLQVPVPRQPRLANLSNRMEGILRLEAFDYFVRTGRLVPLSTLAEIYECTDEEYLAGAIMGLAQDLQRYGLGRATVRDVDSVQAANSLMVECQDFLLQLDFRNGVLRRKFDGTKYCLKALETLLYELAVTGTDAAEEPQPKKAKSSSEEGEDNESSKETSLIPMEELQTLKERMEHRDQLRETLIKKCRDSQKGAKQAIFALHRGDKARAQNLLQQCKSAIQKDLFPIVQEEPPLRSGSFANVLEEYVEARLFATWLYGNDENNESNSSSPAGILLQPHEFDEIALEPEEYLGGLCDLTGEVGRHAVQRGTVRDVQAVQLCLQTNAAIHTNLQGLDVRSMSKKMDMVGRSVEKIERMLYELSLSQAAGGRNVKSDVDVDADMKTGE